ncbi:MAG: hypothetical protein ACI9ON_003364 [Limisphaerales bacterium]|jgi:hypothetical protein
MNCPFCAEEIQNAALLCRFCGAQKVGENEGDQWQRPASEVSDHTHSPPTKGHFTLRSAGVLLILSAVLEGLSMTSAVPLFGELRGGAAAIGYHMLFVTVFLLMGVGLWSAKWWGYRAVLLGTGVYVLDRVTYLLDDAARSASIEAQTFAYKQLLDAVDLQSIDQMASMVTLVTIVCWVGFSLYVHARRQYFRSETR